MSTPSATTYPLGHSHQELERLTIQARTLAAHTNLLFRRAGLAPGQRVLDVGCGAGDVSFIATQLVGETGQVVGIDRSPAAIETARERARFGGHRNVEFIVGDATEPQVTGKFDAIVGRIVLMYMPDPVATLTRLRSLLRLQGFIVMQEGDLSSIGSEPECPLVTQLREWFVAAFAASGAETQMGSRLCSVLHRAGFAPEGSWVSQPSYVGPLLDELDWFSDLAKRIVPTLEAHGIATAAEVDVPTLAARLQAEARARDAIVFAPRLVGVWARHPRA
ncbi:MAG TPA: class I SAM-dependent methyltransferase [Steroidobacteraceae bacterium]|jgi:SAM-dependent methyltransferase|nr:class I SAM-dependent methyltransferase [Steroidobacteraceae bacterium]